MILQHRSSNLIFVSKYSFRSSRKSYGDTAVGRVSLKRVLSKCTVTAKVTPEHRVKNKAYSVTLVLDENEEVIESVECQDCAASRGNKNGFNFKKLLLWVEVFQFTPKDY